MPRQVGHTRVSLQAPGDSGYALPTDLAAYPARHGCLASAPRSRAEHGAAGATGLWRELDMRLRMG